MIFDHFILSQFIKLVEHRYIYYLCFYISHTILYNATKKEYFHQLKRFDFKTICISLYIKHLRCIVHFTEHTTNTNTFFIPLKI